MSETPESIIYLPVKITKPRYADDLQNGHLFMNSLAAYGVWGNLDRARQRGTISKNSYKGGVQFDPLEGATSIVGRLDDNPFFGSAPHEWKEHISKAFYLDEFQLPYSKLFCMYALRYNLKSERFIAPDERIREFGSAAVILDLPEFERRLHAAVSQRYHGVGDIAIREVTYVPEHYAGPLDEFHKTAQFSWQQEIRVRFNPLDCADSKMIEGEQRYRMFCDTKPLILELGNLWSNSLRITTEDLIGLRLPRDLMPWHTMSQT